MVDAGKPEHPSIPHRHPPLGRRQVIAQVVVGAVILISGIAIGGGGMILALKDRIVPKFEPTPTPEPPSGDKSDKGLGPAGWIAEKWKSDYGLDDEQARRARETLAKEFAATEKLREDFRKAEQTQREKFILAVKGILTAEQFAKWEPDFRDMIQRMENMRPFDPRRGGRGGPRPDWRPDRPRDPNDRRDGWRPGPPRDPNGFPGDRPREGFRGPGGRRGEWGRERFRDPNEQHAPPPAGHSPDPNGPPRDFPEPR